jgi:hypothetical protein
MGIPFWPSAWVVDNENISDTFMLMAFVVTAQRFRDCSCKLGDVYQRWDFWGMIAGCWMSGWIHW